MDTEIDAASRLRGKDGVIVALMKMIRQSTALLGQKKTGSIPQRTKISRTHGARAPEEH